MKSNFKKTLLVAMLCSGQAMAQQTIDQSLTINTNGVNSTEILMKKTSNSYYSMFANYSGFGFYNSSTNQNIFYSDVNDYVGIGTQTPLAKLHVNGVIRAKHSVTRDNSADFENESSSGYGLFSRGGGGASDLYSFKIEKYNGVPVMFADGQGNVGIGTSAVDNVQGWNKVLQLNGSNHAKIMATEESTGVKVGMFAHMGNLAKIGTESQHDLTFTAGYWNDVMTLRTNGNVGIGTLVPQEKLSVNGKIRAKEIKVETANWPDYVFEEGYQNQSLSEIEQFIKQNKHLPGVPTAKQAEQEGIELGEMNKILLKKIEELTLLLIEKDKELKKEKEENNARLNEIEKWIKNKK